MLTETAKSVNLKIKMNWKKCLPNTKKNEEKMLNNKLGEMLIFLVSKEIPIVLPTPPAPAVRTGQCDVSRYLPKPPHPAFSCHYLSRDGVSCSSQLVVMRQRPRELQKCCLRFLKNGRSPLASGLPVMWLRFLLCVSYTWADTVTSLNSITECLPHSRHYSRL